MSLRLLYLIFIRACGWLVLDRKVIEVAGTLLTGLPKGCKRRKTIYPARTPQGTR